MASNQLPVAEKAQIISREMGVPYERVREIQRKEVKDCTVEELKIRYNNPNLGKLPEWFDFEQVNKLIWKMVHSNWSKKLEPRYSKEDIHGECWEKVLLTSKQITDIGKEDYMKYTCKIIKLHISNLKYYTGAHKKYFVSTSMDTYYDILNKADSKKLPDSIRYSDILRDSGELPLLKIIDKDTNTILGIKTNDTVYSYSIKGSITDIEPKLLYNVVFNEKNRTLTDVKGKYTINLEEPIKINKTENIKEEYILGEVVDRYVTEKMTQDEIVDACTMNDDKFEELDILFTVSSIQDTMLKDLISVTAYLVAGLDYFEELYIDAVHRLTEEKQFEIESYRTKENVKKLTFKKILKLVAGELSDKYLKKVTDYMQCFVRQNSAVKI
ncbi:hypothetical protein [uncultured Clostridium sp.]|uniref:hypothetical protein n=1 Tax=uncultured Clostridium sp. TaxID=59620 RepID=UPI0026F30E37|nr:hypothetical protein [uncultured Clostridium sp.]